MKQQEAELKEEQRLAKWDDDRRRREKERLDAQAIEARELDDQYRKNEMMRMKIKAERKADRLERKDERQERKDERQERFLFLEDCEEEVQRSKRKEMELAREREEEVQRSTRKEMELAKERSLEHEVRMRQLELDAEHRRGKERYAEQHAKWV